MGLEPTPEFYNKSGNIISKKINLEFLSNLKLVQPGIVISFGKSPIQFQSNSGFSGNYQSPISGFNFGD
jgi:hypothetical protein